MNHYHWRKSASKVSIHHVTKAAVLFNDFDRPPPPPPDESRNSACDHYGWQLHKSAYVTYQSSIAYWQKWQQCQTKLRLGLMRIAGDQVILMTSLHPELSKTQCENTSRPLFAIYLSIYSFIHMSCFNRVAPSVGKHCVSWRRCVQFITINKNKHVVLNRQPYCALVILQTVHQIVLWLPFLRFSQVNHKYTVFKTMFLMPEGCCFIYYACK